MSTESTSPKRFPISGFALYQTQVFKDLCDILGIPWELGTKGMVIDIQEDCVYVTQTFQCAAGVNVVIDTTDFHNKAMRTYYKRPEAEDGGHPDRRDPEDPHCVGEGDQEGR